MVTRIFVEHGFNPGPNNKPADEFNRSGYWENYDLKKLARTARKNPYKAILEKGEPRLYADVKSVLPPSPWVQKVDAFCWPSFSDCEVIKLRRKAVNILHSCLKTPFMARQGFSEDEWLQIIEAHNEEMDLVPGFDIDTDRLVAGDFHQIREALDACGKSCDVEIVNRILNL